MSVAAAPEPPTPAWQHKDPFLGRLPVKEIVDALGWRDDEYFQTATGRLGGHPRPPHKMTAVAGVKSPSSLIALETQTTIDGIEGCIANAIYFAPNPVDPDYRDKRPVFKWSDRPNRWDITRFAAFMMDLDFKPGGVVDQAGAQDLIRRFAEVTNGWYPALLVNSGHGWQPTYRIAGGELTDEFGPSEVSILLGRVHSLVARLAAELDLGVDSVFEAARLQRMPGSINGKMINEPVRAEILPLTRIADHPGTPAGMDLATLIDLLDSEDSDAHTPVTARHLARGRRPVLTTGAHPADEWEWAQDGMRCTWVEGMVAGWPKDTPAARNPWLFKNLIRLAGAHRAGCLSEQAWHDAVAVAVTRFRYLLTIPAQSGPPRAEGPDEVSGMFFRAAATIAGKTYEEVVNEDLNGHDPTDLFMKASHLLPPDDGVDDVPPPSTPLHLAVDTTATAAAVTAAVADIAALAPASSGEAPPSPPSPPPPDVPANDGKDDPARLWPDPKPAGGMSRLARAVLTRHYTWAGHPDGRPRLTLRYVLGDWWIWREGCGWSRFTTADKPIDAVSLMLRRRLEFAWMERTKIISGKSMVVKERLSLTGDAFTELARTIQAIVAADVRAGGKGDRLTPEDIRGWLTRRNASADDYLILANGILDIHTRTLLPHNPDLFDTAGAIGLSWPTDGTRPPRPTRWLQFLGEALPAIVLSPEPPDPIRLVDAETQATLDGIAAASENAATGRTGKAKVVPPGTQIDRMAEVFGYLLMPVTKAQKLILFTGPPGGGKSTALRVLEDLFLDHYIAPTEDDLTGRFGLWSVMHASVVAITDARLDALSMRERTKFLKTVLGIVGEDKKLIQRKLIADVHLRLRCRIIISSNQTLALEDNSGAMMRRVLPIEFPRAPETPDLNLSSKLRTELAGILDWALDGRDRLVRQDFEFTDTVEGDLATETLRQNMMPLDDFIDRYLMEGETVPFDSVLTLYVHWAERHQNTIRAKQWGASQLSRELKSALARRKIIPISYRPRINGERSPGQHWRGLALTEDGHTALKNIATTGLPGD